MKDGIYNEMRRSEETLDSSLLRKGFHSVRLATRSYKKYFMGNIILLENRCFYRSTLFKLRQVRFVSKRIR